MDKEKKIHYHKCFFDGVGKNKTGVTTCGLHYNNHLLLNKILYNGAKVTTIRELVTCKSCLRIINPKQK